jgi:hypothetical protein
MVYKSTREKSKAHEQYIEGKLDIRRTPNSGATVFKKGDLEDELSLFECKTKMNESKSFSIKKEELDKIREESIARSKTFQFYIFNFGDIKENYVVMELRDFRLMYEDYKELFNEYKQNVGAE